MLRRHDLLRVRPEAWPDILAASSCFRALEDHGARRVVAGWAERGWPLILRRPAPEDDGSGIAVGLPLPPCYGKLRLTLSIPHGSVAETVAAVSLSAAVPLPSGWRPQVERLIALGERLALRPILFGALLWQRVTGLPYVQPGSDIDLIWPRPTAEMLPDLLDTLDRLDSAGPVRLDGEIILSAGSGVNWRELRQEFRRPGGAVLVKSMDGADIRCAHTLFA